MIVTISFDLELPDNTLAVTVSAAGLRAAIAAENMVESETDQSCTAGTVRINFSTNKPHQKGPQ